MIFDSIEEFLKRRYTTTEALERLPRIAKYFKNYSEYFCKPLFRDFRTNEIVSLHWESKAELFYQKNLDGGSKSKSKDTEDVPLKKTKKDKKNDHYEKILNTLAHNMINDQSTTSNDDLSKLNIEKEFKNVDQLDTDFGLISVMSIGESFNSFLDSFTQDKHKDNSRKVIVKKGKLMIIINKYI